MAEYANVDSVDHFVLPLSELKHMENVHFRLNESLETTGSHEKPTTTTISLAVVYALVGFFGLLGNLRVLIMLLQHVTALRLLGQRIIDFFSTIRRITPRCSIASTTSTTRWTISVRGTRRLSDQSQLPIYCYVLCLCIVDSLVLIFTPLVVVDLLRGQWVGGELLCRLFWACECLNKFLSTFILVVFSGVCCSAVCSPPLYAKWRRPAVIVATIASCTALSALMMIPIFVYSELYGFGVVVTMIVDAKPPGQVIEHAFVVGLKCLFQPTAQVFLIFTLYTVGIGFGVTSFVQVGFYSALLWSLHKQRQRMHVSRIPFWNVAKTLMALGGFYFLCWTPYWTTTIYTYVRAQSDNPLDDHIVVHVIHILPYFNAAVNPTLYSRLLRQAPGVPGSAMDTPTATEPLLRARREAKKSTTSMDRLTIYGVNGREGNDEIARKETLESLATVTNVCSKDTEQEEYFF